MKGSEDKIGDAFKSVDTNNSGLVEFKTAIKGERLMELNLETVLTKMRVQLSNINGKFDAFQATEKRRRLMKAKMEGNIAKNTKEIISKLNSMSDKEIPTRDPEKEKSYNTLKDTFNGFDADGSAQLGFPEYQETWKFLGRPGDYNAIKQTFDSVDVDQGGTVKCSEFVFSLMGEEVLKFGTLADMELLNELLKSTPGLLASLKDDLNLSAEETRQRAQRNAELQD